MSDISKFCVFVFQNFMFYFLAVLYTAGITFLVYFSSFSFLYYAMLVLIAAFLIRMKLITGRGSTPHKENL